MNTPGPGNGGAPSHINEDVARQYVSAKRELSEARQIITRLTTERDDARRQCTQHVHELSMARNREEALQGRIGQLNEAVRNLQGSAFVGAIAGFTAALLMKKR